MNYEQSASGKLSVSQTVAGRRVVSGAGQSGHDRLNLMAESDPLRKLVLHRNRTEHSTNQAVTP
jgi:hypothetical protein